MNNIQHDILKTILTHSEWWGDQLNKYSIGTKLHLLGREKERSKLIFLTKEEVTNGLKWLIDLGHCDSYSVNPYFEGSTLIINVSIFKNKQETEMIFKRDRVYEDND